MHANLDEDDTATPTNTATSSNRRRLSRQTSMDATRRLQLNHQDSFDVATGRMSAQSSLESNGETWKWLNLTWFVVLIGFQLIGHCLCCFRSSPEEERNSMAVRVCLYWIASLSMWVLLVYAPIGWTAIWGHFKEDCSLTDTAICNTYMDAFSGLIHKRDLRDILLCPLSKELTGKWSLDSDAGHPAGGIDVLLWKHMLTKYTCHISCHRETYVAE